MADTRVTSLIVEVMVPDVLDTRVTSVVAEAIFTDSPDIRVTSLVVEAMFTDPITLSLTGASSAVATVDGDLFNELVGVFLSGSAQTVSRIRGQLIPLVVSSLGSANVVLAYLGTGTDELLGTPTGEATVTGTLGSLGTPPYLPVNYPLGLTDDNVVNLHADLREVMRTPRAEVQGKLSVAFVTSTAGDVDTTGALVNPDIKWTGISIGDAVVIGELFVDGVAELEGSSTGDANVYKIGDLDFEFTEHPFILYMYGNTNVGFDPTDTIGDADSQAFTDGDIVRDFARHLGLLVNINVGFDYTDDVSSDPGFVFQSFPDGDIIRDFNRHLYQYLNIIVPTEGPECRLTVGPAPRSPKDLAPVPTPPRQRNR